VPDTLRSQTLRYDVANLNCGACAVRAKTALAGLRGVESAQVNFATRRADVVTGPDFDMNAIGPAMEAAGYPVTERPAQGRLRLDVSGLHCGSCVARAEAALLEVPGVTEARVNLATGRADVIGTPIDGFDALARHMAEAGYPVSPQAATTDAPTYQGADADQIAPYKRAFWIAALLTLPVFVTEMGGHVLPAFHHWLHMTLGETSLRVGQFLFTSLVLAGPGAVFYKLGVPALLRRAPDMNSLVVLGTAAAWSWSTLVTFVPSAVPEAGRHVYFEAAAVIVTLILLGRWLEARARGQAGAAIAGLIALRPDTAPRIDATCMPRDVALAEIVIGDTLLLRPGARVAVDGIVETGESHVDEAMLTGEPLPVTKAAGDHVTAGTVNGNGSLTYRATAVGADTVLARIVALVEDAQAARLPVQSLIDRVTAVFVPVVLAIALLAGAMWLLVGPDPSKALVVTVSVLIIACPCAMGLATPVSILAGTGRAAELGVLFRQGRALQTLGGVDLIAFDKTGTLTEGRPTVAGLHPSGGATQEGLLRLAASLEATSEHPLAYAIVAEAAARGLELDRVTAFENAAGRGVVGNIGGQSAIVGSAKHLRHSGIEVPDPPVGPETHVHVASGGRYIGRIDLADPPKADAAQTVAGLHAEGVRVAMLSGDGTGSVASVARKLDIREAHGGLSPEDKTDMLERWKSEGLSVAFVGDGINDAPVLAAADVGIALGTGTDVAIEAADVVLISGNPSTVLTARRISRRTLRNIVQNLVWAFGYNVALIPVAAGLLAIFGGPLLNPMLAAGAMAASSVLVVANSLRLKAVRAA
jgi:Cu+-exporting ATPase